VPDYFWERIADDLAGQAHRVGHLNAAIAQAHCEMRSRLGDGCILKETPLKQSISIDIINGFYFNDQNFFSTIL